MISSTERMVKKWCHDKKDLFHYPPCIVPAWEPLIDEMVELLEEWNDHEDNKMRFFQIKEKFGMLVAYIQPVDGAVVNTPKHLQDAINTIANEGHKICRVCHERKVQTVVESRLQWRCLDHWDNDRFVRREQC
jgi:hypothetical protein